MRWRHMACTRFPALYGFTRFEAAATAIDGDPEEPTIAVEGAALATGLQWLPAVEQLGEAAILRFDVVVLAAWTARRDVLYRG